MKTVKGGYELTFKEFNDVLWALNEGQVIALEMRDVKLEQADEWRNIKVKKLFKQAAKYYQDQHWRMMKLFMRIKPKMKGE